MAIGVVWPMEICPISADTVQSSVTHPVIGLLDGLSAEQCNFIQGTTMLLNLRHLLSASQHKYPNGARRLHKY